LTVLLVLSIHAYPLRRKSILTRFDTGGIMKRGYGLGKILKIAVWVFTYACVQVGLMAGTVYSWGGDAELIRDGDPSGVTSISVGGDHSIAVKEDGSVFVWGFTDDPTTVPGNWNNVVAADAGQQEGALVLEDGTVRIYNDGIIGGIEEAPANFNDMVEVVALDDGRGAFLGLQSTGTIRYFYRDDYGYELLPEDAGPYIAIAAGGYLDEARFLALKEDGTVFQWGPGTDTDGNTAENLRGVIDIAVAADYSMALKSDGTVVVWGETDHAVSEKFPENVSDIVDIAAGERHALALKANGEIIAWGSNENGQLDIPQNVRNCIQVAAAGHSVALVSEDGNWGPYPIVDSHSNTGQWLNWVKVDQAPWIYSYSISGWMYCPEENVSDAGAWVYVTK